MSWTDRVQTTRRSGLFPPTTSGATSSFPPVSSSASTHRRSFVQLNTETDSDASAAPSFGTGARPAFRHGDGAGRASTKTLPPADPPATYAGETSPASRWLDTPVITEVIAVCGTSSTPAPSVPASSYDPPDCGNCDYTDAGDCYLDPTACNGWNGSIRIFAGCSLSRDRPATPTDLLR